MQDVLIAYGADMYRKGLLKGAIIASISMITGLAISEISKVIKELKSQKSDEES